MLYPPKPKTDVPCKLCIVYSSFYELPPLQTRNIIFYWNFLPKSTHLFTYHKNPKEREIFFLYEAQTNLLDTNISFSYH